jgi:hypothetical protein
MLKRSPKVNSYLHMSSTPMPNGSVFRFADCVRCPNPDCDKVLRCDPVPSADGNGLDLDCNACGTRVLSIE